MDIKQKYLPLIKEKNGILYYLYILIGLSLNILYFYNLCFNNNVYFVSVVFSLIFYIISIDGLINIILLNFDKNINTSLNINYYYNSYELDNIFSYKIKYLIFLIISNLFLTNLFYP